MNVETTLKEAMVIDGALGAALVDWDSGMSLGTLGGGKHLNLELTAAGNTNVVRAQMRDDLLVFRAPRLFCRS